MIKTRINIAAVQDIFDEVSLGQVDHGGLQTAPVPDAGPEEQAMERRRLRWPFLLLALPLAACLVVPESKSAGGEPRAPVVDERFARGFRGKVVQSETRLYTQKQDPTGSYRENTALFVELFSEEGALVESQTYDLEKDLVYGVSYRSGYADATYERGSEPRLYGFFETDRTGKVIHETIKTFHSDAGGYRVDYECSHQHDGAGRRTLRDCRTSAGAPAESIAVSFDAKGRILRREQKGSLLEDPDLRTGISWREESPLSPVGLLHFRETFAYSSGRDFTVDRTWIGDTEIAVQRMVFRDSLMVSVFHLGPSGDTLGSEAYVHDDRGNVAELQVDFTRWLTGWKRSEINRYEYDTQGNWTVRLKYLVSGTEQLMREEKREITYR